jgi:lipopolysaccharide export LptBFGC system permease protein LptF
MAIFAILWFVYGKWKNNLTALLCGSSLVYPAYIFFKFAVGSIFKTVEIPTEWMTWIPIVLSICTSVSANWILMKRASPQTEEK